MRSYCKTLDYFWWFPPACLVWLSHKVTERCVCSGTGQCYHCDGPDGRCLQFWWLCVVFQDALKAFQMYPHSSAFPHMLLHDYFEKYIIVKKLCFHCIMHELVIFILGIVFISSFWRRLGSMFSFGTEAVMREGPTRWIPQMLQCDLLQGQHGWPAGTLPTSSFSSLFQKTAQWSPIYLSILVFVSRYAVN